MLSNRFRIPARAAFYLMSAAFSLIGSLMVAMMVYLYTMVGLNPLQLVLVGTVLEASAFLFEVPTGVVADTYSRRLSIVIGVLVLGVSFLLLGLAHFFPLVLLAQVICGLGYTFLSGATDAWLADEVGAENVGGVYVRAGQIGRAAELVGLGLAAVLGSIHLALPILIAGGLYLLLGAVLGGVMPETGFQRRLLPKGDRPSTTVAAIWSNASRQLRSMGATVRESLGVIRNRPVLGILILSSFMIGTSTEGFDRLGDAHLVANFTFPALGGWKPVVWFSILGVLGTLFSMAVTAVFQRRVEQVSTNPARSVNALIWLNLAISLCVIVFALAGSFPLAMACLLLRSGLFAVIIPISNAFQVQNTPAHIRATVISMTGQSNAFGQVLGGPAVGWIGTAFSLRAAIVSAGLLVAPISALYARARNYIQVPGAPAATAPAIVEPVVGVTAEAVEE
jgi:DHA3 family tetracycline resistance protein-like MFS transporter